MLTWILKVQLRKLTEMIIFNLLLIYYQNSEIIVFLISFLIFDVLFGNNLQVIHCF